MRPHSYPSYRVNTEYLKEMCPAHLGCLSCQLLVHPFHNATRKQQQCCTNPNNHFTIPSLLSIRNYQPMLPCLHVSTFSPAFNLAPKEEQNARPPFGDAWRLASDQKISPQTGQKCGTQKASPDSRGSLFAFLFLGRFPASKKRPAFRMNPLE